MKRSRAMQDANAHEDAAAYYALNSAPAYNMFGTRDFQDAEGREYRIAFAPRDEDTGSGDTRASASRALVHIRATKEKTLENATADDLLAYYAVLGIPVASIAGRRGDTVRLWTRLPKKKRGQRLAWPRAGTELDLTLVHHDLPIAGDTDVMQHVEVEHTVRGRNTRATGYIDVSDLDPKVCNTLLARQMNVYKREHEVIAARAEQDALEERVTV